MRWRRRLGRVLAISLGVVVLLVMSGIRGDLPRRELLRKYAGPPSRFLRVDDVSVHVRDEGAGPPLLLIHGTSSSLHTWDGWAARLAKHRRVVRLDLPGFGLTGPAHDRDYRVARYARLVVALLDRLGLERADLGGNSLGGWVAATVALEAPARVRRLILVDSAGLRGHKAPAIFALAKVPVLRNALRWVTPRLLVRANVQDVYGDPARVTGALVARYADLLRAPGNRQALIDRLNGPPDPTLDGRLHALRLPVLIQWGGRDTWIPLPFARRFERRIRGARLIFYPGAGHVPMEELPGPTARDAEQFLAGPGWR